MSSPSHVSIFYITIYFKKNLKLLAEIKYDTEIKWDTAGEKNDCGTLLQTVPWSYTIKFPLVVGKSVSWCTLLLPENSSLFVLW